MSLYKVLEPIYIEHFHKHGEESIPFLVNGKLSSKVFLAAYKRLPPIEQMPEDEKKEMKAYVNDLFPEKNQEEKVNACKIIYTIGNIL